VTNYSKVKENDSDSLFTNSGGYIVDWGTNLPYNIKYPADDDRNKLIAWDWEWEWSVSVSDCDETWKLIKNTERYYEDCNTENIIVCTGVGKWHEIAMCNVWQEIAGTGSCFVGTNNKITQSFNVECFPEKTWYHFQWWNNFGFSMSLIPNIITTQVIWLSGSADPYSSSNFFSKGDRYINWSETDEKDLWSGDRKKWPCKVGYHVPTQAEWQSVYQAKSWWIGLDDSVNNMVSQLLLPLAGYRWSTTGASNYALRWQGQTGNYWTSTATNDSTKSYYFYIATGSGVFNIWSTEKVVVAINPSNEWSRAAGYSVRCFRDP
jgi:hypothetical protein